MPAALHPHSGFQHTGFSDPDFLKCAFDLMLDDAQLCLARGCPMAYYWFASSRSDLYTYWSPRLEDILDRPITPASQQFRCVALGLSTYPESGISALTIDTEDRLDRWYGDPGMPASHYLQKVAADADGLKWLDAAVSNGVALDLQGEHAGVLRHALRLYLRHTLDSTRACTPTRMQHQAGRSALQALALHAAAPHLVSLAA